MDKTITYLFIEDRDEALTRDIIDNLESANSELKIKFQKPPIFSDALIEIPKIRYNGLLLDLRLDEDSKAEYRAFTLAQEIRTRTTEGDKHWRDAPIVICSTDPKLKKSYNKNISGQDLFDKKYSKIEDMVDDPDTVSKELISLAKGYEIINRIKSKKKNAKLCDFFGLKVESLKAISEKLVQFNFGSSTSLPTHEYARFILREIIDKPGALIDQTLLFARLGLDPKAPANSKFILETLNVCLYTGPFADGWKRWWWPLVHSWWFKTFKNEPGLVNLTAQERVKLMNSKFKRRLVPAEPIEPNYDTKFWTVCRMLNEPLNPFDGYLMEQNFEPFPWQDKAYISKKAALDPASKARGFNLDPNEKDRFAQYKKAAK